MIKIAHQLNRRVFAGHPAVERCCEAMPAAGYAYAHSQLRVKALEYP